MKHNFIVGVCVFDNQLRVLLHKRLNGTFVGQYCNLGGKVNVGEHPIDACIREVKEEANIDIFNVQPLNYYDITPDCNKTILHFAALCDNPSIMINTEPTKHTDQRWFTMKEVKKLYPMMRKESIHAVNLAYSKAQGFSRYRPYRIGDTYV